GLGVFRIDFQRLFKEFKSLGHTCFGLLLVGHRFGRVIHLAVMEGVFRGENLVRITLGLIVRTLPVINAYPIESLSLGVFLRAFVRSAIFHRLAPFLSLLHVIIDDRDVTESIINDDAVSVGFGEGLLVNRQRLTGERVLLVVIDLSLIVLDHGRAEK